MVSKRVGAVAAILFFGFLLAVVVVAVGAVIWKVSATQSPPEVGPAVTALGLSPCAPRTYRGEIDGRSVVVQVRHGGGGGPKVGRTIVGAWKAEVFVGVDHVALGGDCYTKRPWSKKTGFDELFACLPEQRRKLRDGVPEALAALVTRFDAPVSVDDADRRSVVRSYLGAPVSLSVTLSAAGLTTERAAEAIAALSEVAARME